MRVKLQVIDLDIFLFDHLLHISNRVFKLGFLVHHALLELTADFFYHILDALIQQLLGDSIVVFEVVSVDFEVAFQPHFFERLDPVFKQSLLLVVNEQFLLVNLLDFSSFKV